MCPRRPFLSEILAALAPLRRAARVAGDLAFPRSCGGCSAALPPGLPLEFCPDCLAALPVLSPPFCVRCGDRFNVASPEDADRYRDRECLNCRETPPAFSVARCAFRYEGAVRAAIHALKFEGRKSLAESLGRMLADPAGPVASVIPDADLVTAVPLNARRERERGYNQSRLIARTFADLVSLEFSARVAAKPRPTDPQVGLDREARRRNVRGAFAADHAAVGGRTVLLVDDVITTGATASECARTLLAAGAKEVRVVAIARG